MKFYSFIIFVLFCDFLGFISVVESRKLILVHALWRHGDRNPIHYIPTDQNNSVIKWPQGMEGELTSDGMLQEFILGQQLAESYKQTLKLTPHHIATQIYVRSTDYNRTLMSAYSNFAGMIKAVPNDTVPTVDHWPTTWQPVPVHTVPQSQDTVLEHLHCPTANEIWNKIKHSPQWENETDKNQDFFKWLEKQTGIRSVSLNNIGDIHDPLLFESLHPDTHPWPHWVNNSVYKKISELTAFRQARYYHNQTLARLRGGPLLKDMLSRMLWKVKCMNETSVECAWIKRLKFYAYSAHDSTIMAFLETLARHSVGGMTGAGYLTNGYPSLAACALVELFQESSGSFTVDIWYKNSYKNQTFVPVSVSGGCENGSCSLTTFKNRSQAFIPTKWTEECGLKSLEEATSMPSENSEKEFLSEYLLRDVNYKPVKKTVLSQTTGRQLIMAHALWRHGSRTPAFLFPTDTGNNLSTWFQNKLGELTPLGMMEEFVLGQQLADSYGNRIDPSRIASQMYVRSTDYNRTLMSAYANLAGMFVARKNLMMPSDKGWPTQWQPMPVHTVPLSEDNLLWWPNCKAYYQLLRSRVHTSPLWLETVKENQCFINWLTNKTGTRVSLARMWKISDPLLFESQSPSHTWPSWVNNSIFERILKLKAFSDRNLFHLPELARLKGGNLLGEIVTRMKNKVACIKSPVDAKCRKYTISSLKYYAYSAHDLTVMSFLETLARDDVGNLTGAAALTGGGLPHPASCVLVNLYQEINGTFTVEVSFKKFYNSKKFVPVPVSGGCESGMCSLNMFEERSIPFIPVNWEQECSNIKPPPTSPSPNRASTTSNRHTTLGICSLVFMLSFVFSKGV